MAKQRKNLFGRESAKISTVTFHRASILPKFAPVASSQLKVLKPMSVPLRISGWQTLRRTCGRWLNGIGARLDNPAKSLNRIGTKAKPPTLPTSEQWARFVEAVGNGGGNRNRFSQPCAFFVQFCKFGGFRKGEAGNVLRQDCNFENGTILVVESDDENDSGKDHDFRIKNGQFRVVPMIDAIRALLETIKEFNARNVQSSRPAR